MNKKQCFGRILSILFFSFIYNGNAQVKRQETFPINITIHTSKPYFFVGEKIWFSGYLTNPSTNRLLVNSHPLYVQMYDPSGKLVFNQIFETQGGRGSGFIGLQLAMTGVYRLRAFTQSMSLAKQTNYEKLIYIGSSPTSSESIPISTISKYLKLKTDSTNYKKKEPVKLLLQADSTLEANLSISVYKEFDKTPTSPLLFKLDSNLVDGIEPIEELIYMGHVFRENGSIIADKKVILFINTSNGQLTYTTNTDTNGFFIFNKLAFEGDRTVYWQVNDAKGRIMSDAKIRWIAFPRIPTKIDSLSLISQRVRPLAPHSIDISDGDSLSFDIQTKMLDEIIVKAKKQKSEPLGTPVLYKHPSFVVNLEKVSFGEWGDIFRQIPSTNACFNKLVLFDGARIDKFQDFISPRIIKRIEFVRGSEAMIYGVDCVISMFSMVTPEQINSTSSKIVKLQSYQAKQEFYSPNYDIIKNQELDNRHTLYWNPELILRPNQKDTQVRFFTSDVSGTYRIVVQGISNLGLIYSETSFQIE